MKPARAKAEKERLAEVKFRKLIRRVPDNATFVSILLGFDDKPFRADFYRRAVPYLKFEPIPLEAVNG